MPVLVVCTCGKQSTVPEALVGKNVRCPGCQGVFAATPVQTTPSAPGSTAATVSVQGKHLPSTPPPLPATGTPQLPLETRDRPPPIPIQQELTTSHQPALRSSNTGPWVAGGSAIAVLPSSSTIDFVVAGYDILGELGRGGMGIVYKARHLALKRIVALKMVLDGAHVGPVQLARFRAEAEAVAQLQHPNIVQVHEVGECGGRPFFSLEFVEGGSLDRKVKGTPLLPREAAAVVEKLAHAMHVVHQQGIIHRDLKPANILLTADGTPKITDFGLAKDLGSESGQTASGAVMGTPSYMAPEQASGKVKEIGPLSDVYALGAILYELLVGRPPFKGATVLETLMQVTTDEPVAPSRFVAKVPADLETICLKCLEKVPRKRYASAAELAEDLGRWLAGEPIRARPVGRRERTWKWVRRNPVVAALVMAMVGSLLLGTGVASAFALDARRKAADERVARQQANDNETRAISGETAARKSEVKSRELYLESVVQSANAARRRGQLTQALILFDQSLKEGHPDTVELLLNKARALAALNRMEEATPMLDDLMKRNDQAGCAGEILLLRTEVATGKERDNVVSWIRRSIQLGLSAAENEYAEGLLAATTPKAIEQFRKTIRLDPYHHSARCGLMMTLILSGRAEEARAVAQESKGMFPDDPNFRYCLALVFALQNNPNAGRAELQDIQAHVSKDNMEMMLLSVDIVAIVGSYDGFHDPGAAEKLMLIVAKIAPSVARMLLTGPDSGQRDLGATLANKMRLPPVVERSIGSVLNMAFSALRGNFDEKLLEDIRRTLAVHPEGTLRYILGMLLLRQERYAEAEKELLTAANEPAVVSVRRSALYFALICEIAQTSPKKTMNPDPAVMRRAAGHVRELYRPGSLRVTEAEVLVAGAIHTKEFDLARGIAMEWKLLAPDDMDARRKHIEALFFSGDMLNAAYEAARMPNDAQAQQIRKDALDILAGYLKNQRSP